MVAFNKSTDLPTSIVTVEQNLLWSAYVLAQLQGTNMVREVGSTFESPRARVYESLSPNDGNLIIIRAALPRPVDHAEYAEKPWGANRVLAWANTIGANVPTGFTS
jgi:hypothetical protein